MKTYEYHRISKLEEQMGMAGVDQEIIARIMEGGESILRKTSPEKKAEWMQGAMLKMNQLLDMETRKAVRKGCACCLGGKRLKTSLSIAKENRSLEERVEAANTANYIGNLTQQENGEIMVRFYPEGLDNYRCVCMPKAEKPLPITYCYCCGGHVKHHLQIALGRELDCTTRSSALSSGGKLGCVFSFKLKE
jgi:hypothetical protein